MDAIRQTASFMGRYFLYRIHPLTIGEIFSKNHLPSEPIRYQFQVSQTCLEKLLSFGGYPEPYLKEDLLFNNRW